MQAVWLMFRTLECLLGIICIGIHIYGFLDKFEPLPHNMLFCGTFFGFTIFSIFGNVSIIMGFPLATLMEAIICGCAAIFFILSSIFSMYYAEMDFHLMYLSDYEESIHPFFAVSKAQSISSLLCASIYLLHSVFAIDSLLIHEDQCPQCVCSPSTISTSVDEEICIKPIKLYFCGKFIHQKLEANGWIQRLNGQQLS